MFIISDIWASRVKLGMFLLLLVVVLIFYVRNTMLYCSFSLESFNSKNQVTFFPYGVYKITIIGSNCTTQLRQCIHFFNFGCTPMARMNDPHSNNKSNLKKKKKQHYQCIPTQARPSNCGLKFSTHARMKIILANQVV